MTDEQIIGKQEKDVFVLKILENSKFIASVIP